MTRFKRQDVIDLLNPDGEYKVGVISQGGDWDLPGIRLTHPDADPNEHVMIVPFLDPQGPTSGTVDHDDAEVYALEVQTWNADSRGGCQSTCEHTAALYGIATARLGKAEFQLCGDYHEIF